jgi:hypothetical protein
MRLIAALLVATLAWSVAGCGPNGENGENATTSPATSLPAAQEGAMRIQLEIGDDRFHATLDDSAASRDLRRQLPITLTMRDHGGVEKTGALTSALSLDGQPSGADPDVGHVGYYAPGNDLVLYYGDQSYFEGIVLLGHLEGDAAEQISEMDGTITATVRALDD